ncbi:MAG: TlpA family protein disulfide reductase, partial [Myxococcales bacterium]|nr:TlpA family protein disulfide reductase [Myxococcales bacterium]
FTAKIDVNALETYDLEKLKERIKGSGKKVTVVALWATWCAPCIEEMAGFDAFQKAHAGDGLEVLGLCTDDRADMGQKIQDVYDRTKVAYDQGLLAPGNEDAFFKALGEEWDGMLPKTVVFDDKGEKIMMFTAAVTPAMLDEKVAPLLSAK